MTTIPLKTPLCLSCSPGVWKLILRSSTGSVGWWDDMALLQGKLPFLPSASALFLESNGHTRLFYFHCTEKN